ncbi:MAG: hypothetical protein EXS50_01765 [Candidatus Taylorbacteria bacterium]|nr:hypothetical protein [Candidatus Taylorbacteria bacterium]
MADEENVVVPQEVSAPEAVVGSSQTSTTVEAASTEASNAVDLQEVLEEVTIAPEVMEGLPNVPIDNPNPVVSTIENISQVHAQVVPDVQSVIETPQLGGIEALFVMAQKAIQFRKRKKLDHVMSLFNSTANITNDEVEKLLHVSDATACRYLGILEKEGKILRNGKTGRGVSYSKI